MSNAQKNRTLKRNFQGYSVDPSNVLIGLGASSISHFPNGYAQNASATSQYAAAIDQHEFAIIRGHVFNHDDRVRAKIINSLMCNFDVQTADIINNFAINRDALYSEFVEINRKFEYLLVVNERGLFVPPKVRPLTRMIAREFDAYELSRAGHSAAI